MITAAVALAQAPFIQALFVILVLALAADWVHARRSR